MTGKPQYKQVDIRMMKSTYSPDQWAEAMARLEQYYPSAYALITGELAQRQREMFDAEFISLALPVQEIRRSC